MSRIWLVRCRGCDQHFELRCQSWINQLLPEHEYSRWTSGKEERWFCPSNGRVNDVVPLGYRNG